MEDVLIANAKKTGSFVSIPTRLWKIFFGNSNLKGEIIRKTKKDIKVLVTEGMFVVYTDDLDYFQLKQKLKKMLKQVDSVAIPGVYVTGGEERVDGVYSR